MRKFLGYTICALPFICLFLYGVKSIGLTDTFCAFVLTALIMSVTFLGVYLITNK